MNSFSILSKNIKKLITLVFFVLPFSAISQNNVIVGQNIETACGLTNVSAPYPESAVDIWKDGCDIFKVLTSSDEVTIEFEACNTTYTTAALQFLDLNLDPISVTNPDVSLIYPGGDLVYAIVVYYSPSESGYFYDVFSYDRTVPTILNRFERIELDNVTQPPAINDNGIRIDANLNGDFVIAWDDLDNGLIYLIPGYLDGSIPSLNCQDDMFSFLCAGVYVPVEFPYSDVTAPDVAIAEGSTPGQADVFISFLPLSRDKVMVDQQTFTDLRYDNIVMAPSLPSTIVIFQNNIFDYDYNGDLFGRPRIASPGEISADWSLVYRVDINGDYHICGNTRWHGTDFHHNYTDNTESLFIEEGISVPANDWQDNPAISYGFEEETGNVAQIAWEGGWASALPAGTGGRTIVSVSIDEVGHVNTALCVPGGKGYKMVPYDPNLTSFDPYATSNPSIAGRHSTDHLKMVVAWWEATNADVFKKDFLWCDASFRKPLSQQINYEIDINRKNIIYPNPASGPINIKLNEWKVVEQGSIEIFDMTGKRVDIFRGDRITIENIFSNRTGMLRAGVYLIKSQTKSGRTWSQKVIKQ